MSWHEALFEKMLVYSDQWWRPVCNFYKQSLDFCPFLSYNGIKMIRRFFDEQDNWSFWRDCFVVLTAAVIFAVGGQKKGLVYEGEIVDIPRLDQITASLEAESPAPYHVYKIDAETKLPITGSITVELPTGKSIATTVISFDKDGESFSLRFEDNRLTGYMRLSEQENMLDAALHGEWKDDKKTLAVLLDAYSAEAPQAIDRYRNAVSEP